MKTFNSKEKVMGRFSRGLAVVYAFLQPTEKNAAFFFLLCMAHRLVRLFFSGKYKKTKYRQKFAVVGLGLWY